MSFTYGFFNSKNNDRRYDATQMSSIFDGIIKDGVFMSIGHALNVKAQDDPNMSIIVQEGRAWFNHTWSLVDAPYIINVAPSDLLFDRIDAVVLEVNHEEDIRANSIKIVAGTPSGTPQKPAMRHSEKVNQYALAYITVKKEAIKITQAEIENNIGKGDCPYVTGILETVNIDNLVAQWETQWNQWLSSNTTEYRNFMDNFMAIMAEFQNQAEIQFDVWFQHMKDQLSVDAAGNLQIQIDGINKQIPGFQLKSEAVQVYSGTQDPVSELGKDGDIYVKYEL